MCRFLLARWGARISIEGKPDPSDGSAADPTLWHAQVRVRRPAGLEGSLSLDGDLLIGSVRSFWRQCLFSVELDRLCMVIRARPERRAEVKESVALVHRHLVSILDPVARAAAERFPFGHRLRWFVYESVVNGPAARVAQAAETCPGLLLFASQMRALRLNESSRRIVEGFGDGQPLSRVLTAAVDAWSATLAGTQRQDLGTLVETQRARLRRAGPLVPPALLWSPWRGRVIPEDIPVAPTENLAWFELMHAMNAVAADPRLSQHQRAALRAFASRHALRLLANARRTVGRPGATVETVLGSLVDYLVATNRIPSRNTDPIELSRESVAWHRQLWRRPYVTRFPVDFPLRTDAVRGCETWVKDDARISLLRTAGELEAEGHAMRHCVASYLARAIAGEAIFFHAEIRKSAITIHIAPDPSGFQLVQAAGRNNRALTQRERSLVDAWRADVNTMLQQRRTGGTALLNGEFLG